MIHSFINHYHVVWVFGFLLLFLFWRVFCVGLFCFWFLIFDVAYQNISTESTTGLQLLYMDLCQSCLLCFPSDIVLPFNIIKSLFWSILSVKKKKCSRTIKFRRNRSILELLSYCSSHKLRSLSILCKDYKTNSDYQECKWAKLKSFVGCPNTTGISEIIQYVLALRVLYPL